MMIMYEKVKNVGISFSLYIDTQLLSFCTVLYLYEFKFFSIFGSCNEFIYLFIYECLPRIASSVLNWYQSCLPWETPTGEPMALVVISNFHHWRPHELGTLRS